ncbi:hypothetical protein LCGC14_2016490 [marine sediment metagenome]|uniref:MoaB/Mog domain-containing protein n=1 Tax=marine sediment metagenome TaxID=412755 RepID=A0A0F9HVZ9_9ZZZZ|nr:competence/damage-inducible protein A [Methylophaga sp.]
MNIGALIIGDEILSGKRQDKHFARLQSVLAERGLELSWTFIVGDDPDQLERALRFSMASEDLVFSFGGIGATPDDRTRQTVALVNDLAIIPHPEAIAEIEAQFGESAYPNRILMGYLPEGSEIIPNPINRVPGFSLKHHHFMPGFPEMAWPMFEWVLDNQYDSLRDLRPKSERIITITKGRESDLLTTMNDIVNQFPDLKLSSLPHLGEVPFIELSLRGDQAQIETAMQIMIDAVEAAGFVWENH